MGKSWWKWEIWLRARLRRPYHLSHTHGDGGRGGEKRGWGTRWGRNPRSSTGQVAGGGAVCTSGRWREKRPERSAWRGQGCEAGWSRTLAKRAPSKPWRRRAALQSPALAELGRSAGSCPEFPLLLHRDGPACPKEARLRRLSLSSSGRHTHRILPVLPVVGVGTQRGRHLESVWRQRRLPSWERGPPQSRQALRLAPGPLTSYLCVLGALVRHDVTQGVFA